MDDITIADVTRPRGETAQSRTTTIYRIAELIGRYKSEHDRRTGKWHVWDCEAGRRIEAFYPDEMTARAGARLAAACDIRALFDAPAAAKR